MVKQTNDPGQNTGGQFLTFCLADEIFGVPIGMVREVLIMSQLPGFQELSIF